ncbi:putative metal-binding motif-containing protein, partial [Candidatus Woesearchaeota archaeon]|nr:putative metal-binding motif-containing protein [Candidatus Woesearchaeota archaeon]
MKLSLKLLLVIFAALFISGCVRSVCRGPSIIEEGSGGVGRCVSAICQQNIDPGCEFYFPGEKGLCPGNLVCDSSCTCSPLFQDNDDDVYCIDLSDNESTSCNEKPKDCDDQNSKINPGAAEVCDNIDNNCDGQVDEDGICANYLYICKDSEPNIAEAGCLRPWCTCAVDDTECSNPGRRILGCTVPQLRLENLAVGVQDAYAYFCNPNDGSCENASLFAEGDFKICNSTESLCEDGEDNDCDGNIDSVDEDCFSCQPGECRLIDQQWCDDTGNLISENYCQQCSGLDASCQGEAEPCDAGERSCGSGCLPGACDISANKVCNENGYWASAGYEAQCSVNDSEFSTTSCTPGACDTEADKTCLSDLGPDWTANLFCGDDRTCGDTYDSECNAACAANSCDVSSNTFCTSSEAWSTSGYCSQCGFTDADCGILACEEGTCDYSSHKYCEGGLWVDASVDEYCSVCGNAQDPLHFCSCAPVSSNETNCGDFSDDDCDGNVDCSDSDCDPNSAICLSPPCQSGDTRNCGLSVGLCSQGTQTCSGGQWDACAGSEGPFAEICNSFDDDCDGSTDENCGSCQTGETRICGTEAGQCSGGLQECNEQGFWSICFGTSYVNPGLEVCDGMDNDCDGETDEGCSCQAEQTQACGNDIGECEMGMQSCANGQWGTCTGGKGEFPEVCDDTKDNDCDGSTDDEDGDCQASASLTATCYDSIKNQDESDVDCGGVCDPCNEVSCNDRKKNGDEDGLDCGGSDCPLCKDQKEINEIMNEEVCGDKVCEGDEDISCPGDCKPVDEEKGADIFNVIFVILLVLSLLGGVWWFLKKKGTGLGKGISLGKSEEKKAEQMQQPRMQQSMTRPQVRPKFGKSLEEKRLEQSMKEAEQLFKKK